MKVSPDDWLYASTTWKKEIGLKLYLDGIEMASDNQGKEVQRPLNVNKPNLCFGDDVKRTGQFAKFTIASFSTFNTFLSSTVMRSVYTFFSRRGMVEDTYIFLCVQRL